MINKYNANISINDVEFGECSTDCFCTICKNNDISIDFAYNSNVKSPLYFIVSLYYGDMFKILRLSLLESKYMNRKYEELFSLEEMNKVMNYLKEDGIWESIINFFNNECSYSYFPDNKPLSLNLPIPDYTLLCK